MSTLALALGFAGAAWAEEPTAPPTQPSAEVEDPTVEDGTLPAVDPLAKPKRGPARWRQRQLPPEADFYNNHVDLKLRLGFNGTSPNPFTILTSLAGWNELSLTADAGVASWRDFTIGVGAEVHYGQSLILGLINGPIADYDDYRFSWTSTDAGGAVRVTAHTTVLRGVDPYLMVGLGASAFRLQAELIGAGLAGADHLSALLRVEVGGGLNWRLGTKGWIIGLELRYLLSAELTPVARFVFEDGDRKAVFARSASHNPPKGFSWVVQVGYRF